MWITNLSNKALLGNLNNQTGKKGFEPLSSGFGNRHSYH